MSKITLTKTTFECIIFFTFLFFTFPPLHSAGTTGAQFLKLGVGARATGMGESFVAIADDASAIFWNPAGIAKLSSKELSASHHAYVQTINYESIAYAQPLKNSAWGAGVHYLYLNDIERRDKNGDSQGSFSAADFSFSISFARALIPDSHLLGGGNLKLVRQQIESFHANAFALDFGILAPVFNSGLTFGFAVQNLGTDIQFINESFSLPRTVRTGLSWSSQKLPLTIASSVSIPKENGPSYQFGSELWALSSFALRAGYLIRSADSQFYSSNSKFKIEGAVSGLSGFMTGAGIKFLDMQLDYSFTPLGDLGNSHRATLGMKFK